MYISQYIPKEISVTQKSRLLPGILILFKLSNPQENPLGPERV